MVLRDIRRRIVSGFGVLRLRQKEKREQNWRKTGRESKEAREPYLGSEKQTALCGDPVMRDRRVSCP